MTTALSPHLEARVIDLHSIKPLDEEMLRSFEMPIITVEDHWREGRPR
jgi:transketolase C-terminal domain/subunit